MTENRPFLPFFANRLDQNWTKINSDKTRLAAREFPLGRDVWCREPSRSERSRNVSNRSKENERVVPRRQKAAPLPEVGGAIIERVDDERATANQYSASDRSDQRVPQKAGPDTSAGPGFIRRELAEQEARDGIGRLSRPDGRDDRGRCQTVVPDHAAAIMDDHDNREAFSLIGQRPDLQPVIEGTLATRKARDVVLFAQEFGRREGQDRPSTTFVARLPGRFALKQIDHLGYSLRRCCDR